MTSPHFQHIIETIQRRYDAEHDIDPNGPPVRFVEYSLLELILEQQKQIKSLEDDLWDLEQKVRHIEFNMP